MNEDRELKVFLRHLQGEEPDDIEVVYGPPGAGKTKYVKDQIAPGDVAIDLDYIAAAVQLSGDIHQDRAGRLDAALDIQDALVDAVASGRIRYKKAYIITTRNGKEKADRLGAKLTVIDPGKDKTIEQIMNDRTVKDTELTRKRAAAAEKWYMDQE